MAKRTQETEGTGPISIVEAVVPGQAEPVAEDKTPAATAQREAVYSAAELSRASIRVFGKTVSPDIVATALQLGGLEAATVAEAVQLVNKLMEKEVK